MKINPSKTINELITVLAYVNDVDERRKIFHTYRVSIFSASIARGIVPIKKLKEIFYAAVLHDIGGIGFPYHIIHYLKRNDKKTQDILLSHPIIGAQLISNIPKLTNVAKLILDHHEWINGHGYPRGKTGKYIPLGSQIIRLADCADILIQKNQAHTLKQLEKHLALNIDKEYPGNLLNRLLYALKKDGVFKRVTQTDKIEGIFNEIKEKVGLIKIPRRIDAIGTALEVIAQIIDMKHPYTSGHSQRVSHYAMAIALVMNFKDDEITKIKWAGLIHDIGKLRVPRNILDKPGVLSKDEFQRVKEHAALTNKILNMVSTLKDIALLASSHHERFDGSGYPRGLKGEEISIGARILAICDAFDAMTSNRPYRQTLGTVAACEELQKGAGTQFDPDIVKQALPLFKNLGL